MLDAKSRRRIDSYVHLLLPCLSEALCFPILAMYLDDRRKTRREIGFMALRKCNIGPNLAANLERRFRDTGDVQFLKFVLRNPLPFQLETAKQMAAAFAEVDDEYWSMRVIESQLKCNRDVGMALANSYPKQFVWACGRIGAPSFTEDIRRMYDQANDKVSLLGIVTWAFGKLGALSELQRLDVELSNLEKEFE